MPLNLSTGADLVASPAFRRRVGMAFYLVARQAFTENVNVVGHEQRVNFARSIILQDADQFQQYAAMVATDDAIRSGGPYTELTPPSDASIIAAVSAMWNTLSAVPTA